MARLSAWHAPGGQRFVLQRRHRRRRSDARDLARRVAATTYALTAPVSRVAPMLP